MSKTGNLIQLILCLFITLWAFPTTVFAVTPAQINTELLKEVTNYPEELLGLPEWCNIQGTRQEQWICTVYNNPGLHPLWVDTNGPTDQAKHILSALQAVTPDGLNSGDYRVVQIEALWKSRTARDLAKLDIDITIGLLEYIHDMQEGRFAPKYKDPKLFDQAGGNSVFDPVLAISKARRDNDMAAFLSNLAPKHRHYLALKSALKHYRSIAEKSGWPEFSAGATLHPLGSDTRVPVLSQLLYITGDLTKLSGSEQQIYTTELVEAVKRFQERHSLKTDGIIGKETTRALSLPVARLIQQILINMERWRWTEHKLGSKYVLVDIAGFTLQGVVNNVTQLEMRVIVGKLRHETPIFSDSIKYIEFNPFWNITPSIARNEMLSDLRDDNKYLTSKHIKLFSSWQADAEELNPEMINWDEVSRKEISRFKLRQEPGPWNALGVVKFVFPNKYSIYLHDTPLPSLFEKTDRAFSHGCIRLSEPIQLAEFLLQSNDAKWTEKRILQVVENKKRKVVSLHTPIPVHLVYQTAWVAKDGNLHFSKDLYGRDRKLMEALFEEE